MGKFEINDSTAGAARLVIDSSGNVGIGTTSPGTRLHIYSSGAFADAELTLENVAYAKWSMRPDGGGRLQFLKNGSDMGSLSSTGVWTDASDASKKTDVADLSYGLSDLLRLQPRFYRMKDTGLPQIGFIAQEIEQIIPEVVSGEEGRKGVAHGHLTPLLVKAVQELDAENDKLKASEERAQLKIEALEARSEKLEEKVH